MGASISPNLQQLQRAMLFVDGTNLLYRLRDANLVVPSLSRLLTGFSFVAAGREVARIYFYSIQQHIDSAILRHGAQFFDGVRVVLGDSIPTDGGNFKEKGVDALLVADLVYHAASRNCDAAVLVSTDTDFCHAIKRVEDFGCRTAVLGICAELPERLKRSADQSNVITKDNIVSTNLGQVAS